MTSRDGVASRRLRVGRPRDTLALFAAVALAAIVPATARAGWVTSNDFPPVFRVDELAPNTPKVCRDGFVWQVADRARRLEQVFVAPLDGQGRPDTDARLTSRDNLKLKDGPIAIPKAELSGLLDRYYEGPTEETKVFNALHTVTHQFNFKQRRQPQPGTIVAVSFLRDKDDPENAEIPADQLKDATSPFVVQDCWLNHHS